VGDGVAAQKTERAIDADVVLIAEHRYGDLDLALVAVTRPGFALLAAFDRPAPIAVDLGAARRHPCARHPAADKAFNRSSLSKNPGCPPSPIPRTPKPRSGRFDFKFNRFLEAPDHHRLLCQACPRSLDPYCSYQIARFQK